MKIPVGMSKPNKGKIANVNDWMIEEIVCDSISARLSSAYRERFGDFALNPFLKRVFITYKF